VQPTHGCGVERQQTPEGGLAHTYVLKWRGCYRAAREAVISALLVVEQSEQRRLRVQIGDRGKGALSAAHYQQIIMD
jgi:hypothetical protein